MPQIDFSKPITNLDGQPLEEGKGGTLGGACLNVLTNQLVGDERMPGEQKAKFFELAVAIHGAKEPLDLSVEDVALLKERVGRAYPPIIVGRAWAMLDPKG